MNSSWISRFQVFISGSSRQNSFEQGNGGHTASLNDLKGDKAVNEENYFSFSLPFFHAGTSNNVIAEFAEIKGTFRSVDCEFTENLWSNLKGKQKKYGCILEIKIKLTCPAIVNIDKESEIVKKLAEEFFGKEMVGEEMFPMLGSDDFAFFLGFISESV